MKTKHQNVRNLHQTEMNNHNKCKRMFAVFGTHYPDDTFY